MAPEPRRSARRLACALLLAAAGWTAAVAARDPQPGDPQPGDPQPGDPQPGVPPAPAAGLSPEEAKRLLEDGAALYRSGDLPGAVAILERARAAYRGAGDGEGESTALYALGIVRARQRKYDEAFEAFEGALAIARARGDAEDEATVLREIAGIYVDRRQLDKAIETLEAALPIQVETGAREDEAESRHNLGALYAAEGDGDKALEQLGRALAIRRELGDAGSEAHTLDSLGQVHEKLGQAEQALGFYRQALAIQRQLGDLGEADEILRRIAVLDARAEGPASPPDKRQLKRAAKAAELESEATALLLRGDPAAARGRFERAVDLFREVGHRGGEARARLGLGVVLMQLTEYAAATEHLQNSLELARALGDRDVEANALNNLGGIHLVQGRLPDALAFFERSLALWRKLHDTPAELRTLGNLAGVRIALGDLAKAEESLLELLPRQRGSDRTDTLLNLGTVRARQKRFPEAREAFEQALALQRSRNHPGVRTTLGNLAAVHGEMGELSRALELLDAALALDREVGDRMSECSDLANIGAMLSLQGEHEKAVEPLGQALEIARELGAPRSESSVLAGLGRVEQARGRPAEALELFLQSIAIEEELQALGRVEELKIRLGEQSAELYRLAVPLLIELGRPAEAFDLAERARARAFLDQLGNDRPAGRAGAGVAGAGEEREARLALAGLDHLLARERARPRAEQDAARIRSLTEQVAAKRAEYAELLGRLKRSDPEYASLLSVAPSKLAEVQGLLAPDTTLLSYFVTAEATLAFVVGRESLQAFELPVSEAELESAVAEVRSFPRLDGPPPPALAQLYASLVAPLRPALATPLVGIVPHGVLHLLPFAALHDGEGWFGEDVTLFLLPSASTLQFVERKRKSAGGSALALAQGRAAGLPPLRHAEQEAEAVAALYETEALVGAAATETALRARAASAGVLHVAAHAQLNAVTPIFSRVVLAPSDDVLNREADGMLELREVYDLDLAQAGLVVLSACQTQLGEHSRGDDLIGLNRAFLYAGAPTVVASLWSVDDRATSVLMEAFHRHLRQGLGKAAALQAAQAETRREHPHPFHWAAFVLTGDPR